MKRRTCTIRNPTPDRVKKITALLSDKLAQDIVVIDMHEQSSVADYFIICSVQSERQSRAMAAHIRDTLAKAGVRPQGMEGEQTGAWVVMDYGDIVVHIFLSSLRSYYDIDGLWADAQRAVID